MASTTSDLPDAGETVFFFNTSVGMPTNITVGKYVVDEAKRNHTVMVASIMFGTGVFGNLLALFVLATSAIEQRRTLFYKLVAGLAMTDLFGTCALSPVVISVYVNDFRWVGGVPLCHYFSFMMVFASFTTLLIVTAMAVERYICVKHPYLYHTRLTATFAKIALIGSWVLAALFASLPLVGFVTSTCNVVVIYTLIRIRTKQSALNSSDGSTRKFNSVHKRYAEIQMVVLLIGITIVFSSCYCPLMIYVLLCQTGLVSNMNTDKMGLLLVRFASFNQILDPWVYILFRREVVWKIVNTIKCILRIEPKPVNFDLQAKAAVDEDDLSCGTMCFQCLCEPPNSRPNMMSRASITIQKSPTMSRRVSEARRLSENLYGNGNVTSKLLITPPSPADQKLLNSFRKQSNV